eukprot:COSAG02_NODE_62434_length_266_cov_0.556886_1_plen_25_part_01
MFASKANYDDTGVSVPVHKFCAWMA